MSDQTLAAASVAAQAPPTSALIRQEQEQTQLERQKIARLTEQRTVIRNTVAKGATDAELVMYFTLAVRYGLDPFLGEIWCYKPEGENGPAVIKAGRDGFLKIAHNHPDFEGMQSHVVCEKDEFELDPVSGTVKHAIRPNRGPAVGAWAVVRRKGRMPVSFYAPLDQHAKPKPNSGRDGIWQKHPALMILKVAEAHTLKKAFAISGLDYGSPLEHGVHGPIETNRPPMIDTDRDPYEVETALRARDAIDVSATPAEPAGSDRAAAHAMIEGLPADEVPYALSQMEEPYAGPVVLPDGSPGVSSAAAEHDEFADDQPKLV